MDSDNRELLEKVLELVEENNRILRKMRREVLWGKIFHALYWVVIIGISVGAYYYIQPYLESMLQIIGAGKEGFENLGKLSETMQALPK